MKILIADDNPTNLKLLQAQLEAEGHTVLHANDGLEALDLLQGEGADAVISDIFMPRMDGFRLCQQVRLHERLKHIPFIIYSASYLSSNDEKLAAEVGADKYLRKPAEVADILSALHQSLQTPPDQRPQTIPNVLEADLLKEYSERLVGKMEDMNLQLQRQTEDLRREIEERKRAEETLAQHVRLAVLEAEIARTITRKEGFENMLSRCAGAIVEHLGAAFARIWVLNRKTRTLELCASAGMYTHLDGAHARIPVGKFKIGLIAEEKKPHLTNDVQNDPRVSDPEWARREGMVAFAGYPLVSQDEVVGVVALFARHPLSESILSALGSISAAITMGITQHRGEEDLRKQLDQIQSLHRIDTAISSGMDLQLILRLFLEEVTKCLSVDAAAVLVFNEKSLTLNVGATRGFRALALSRSALRIGEGHAGRAALSRSLTRVPDLRRSSVAIGGSHNLGGEDFVAYFALPLHAKGRLKGVLELYHRTEIQPDEEWLQFLNTLGGQGAIAVDDAEMFSGLQQSNYELILAYEQTLAGWAKALDIRDNETEGHTQRVTQLSVQLAETMGIVEPELTKIRRGALLHDIGKLGIPDNILLKPGKLTEEEWVVMRKHPVYAFEWLSPIDYLRSALDIPYCHHERWDGTGYPRGLKGETIPFAARIFAIVDVWDALRSDRPYRKAWPKEKVLEHIMSLIGTHFDPMVAEAFLKMEME